MANATKAAKSARESSPAEKKAIWQQQRDALKHIDLSEDTQRQIVFARGSPKTDEYHAYPEATWPEREKIIARHTNFALALMYFLQNDESVPPAKRKGFRRIGLPLDEFPDNHNLPYEMYV